MDLESHRWLYEVQRVFSRSAYAVDLNPCHVRRSCVSRLASHVVLVWMPVRQAWRVQCGSKCSDALHVRCATRLRIALPYRVAESNLPCGLAAALIYSFGFFRPNHLGMGAHCLAEAGLRIPHVYLPREASVVACDDRSGGGRLG